MTDLDGLGALLSRSVPDLPHPPDRLALVSAKARRRSRRIRVNTAVGAAVAITVVAAIGYLPARDATLPIALSKTPIDCASDSLGSVRRQALPAGFRPIAVYTCGQATRRFAGEGTWDVAITKRADTGLDRFVTGLRTTPAHASKPPSASSGCFMDLEASPVVVLADRDGHTISPPFPRNYCDQLDFAVAKAFSGLPWKIVKETRVRQRETPAELATGCDPSIKDMIGFEIKGNNISPGTQKPVFSPRPTSMSLCAYTDIPGSDNYPEGNFAAGATIKGTELSRVAALMEAAPAAGPCTLRRTRFASITVQPMSQNFGLELDGCHRLMATRGGHNTLLSPDLALFRLLHLNTATP